MVIDKIKKINPKEPDKKNEKASDMLVGKWVKCNKCKEILYKEDLKNNYSICPNCGQYFRLSSRRRIKQREERVDFLLSFFLFMEKKVT